MARWFLSFIWLEINCIYDYWRFKVFYAKSVQKKSGRNVLEAWILQDKHRIEKAFSLPSPRVGFGEKVILRLCTNLKLYRQDFGKTDVYYIGVGALKAYREFHKEISCHEPEFFERCATEFFEDFSNPLCNRAGYSSHFNIGEQSDSRWFSEYAALRKSCRNYDLDKSRTIGEVQLREIMETAITAPSVCNRQHWRVHFFSGDKVKTILEYQNGNAGFDSNVPWLALVTSDLGAFYSPDERNQPYVDGGIFSMNLLYAIQEKGLSSCPLNWCNSFFKDRSFRKLGYVPANEVVIVAIAFGYPKPDALYAKSPRLPVKSFYNIH